MIEIKDLSLTFKNADEDPAYNTQQVNPPCCVL